MLFSSISFLFYFLPIILIVYFVVPKAAKNLVLLAASLIFYWWGEPRYVFLMLFTIAFAYVCGLLIDRFRGRKLSKVFLGISVVGELMVLGYFKYADFFLGSVNSVLQTQLPLLAIALPIGISFYTFQTLSYTIDVYRNEVAVQRSLIKLATYIALFPQLIAGPIVRYSVVERELSERRTGIGDVGEGMNRFVIGLAKKVLIANQLGALVVALRGTGEASVLMYWVITIAFALQIYFDFSGYSDMAIGLGRVFGFHFPENFNYPFIAKSITEFWRRWHISLGSWFRDYVYIPLGGSRVGKARQMFNILAVWFLTGLWHGADWTFVLWGLYFAFFLVLEKVWLHRWLDRLPTAANRVYLLLVTVFSFAIFNGDGLSGMLTDLAGMVGLAGGGLVSAQTLYYVTSYGVVLLLALVGATPLPKQLMIRFHESEIGSKIMVVVQPLALLALLAVCTAYLVDGSFNPFLYFRF